MLKSDLEIEYRQKIENINKILKEINALNEKDRVTCYEFSIINPASSLYLSYTFGCMRNMDIGDVIMSYSAIRGMIEVMGFMAYFEHNDPEKEVYKKYLSKGRIYSKTEKDKKFKEVSISSQIASIDMITKTHGLKDLYDNFSRKMHFGIEHIDPMLIKIDRTISSRKMFHIFVGKYEDKDMSVLYGIIDDLNNTMFQILSHYKKAKVENNPSCNRLKYIATDEELYKIK